MALLTSVLKALAPYFIDLVVDILKAEEDPEKDTSYKKHDYVIGQLHDRVKTDPELNNVDNRHIMDAANFKIHETVKKLKDQGIIKRKGE
jgi:hypothetical protein